MRNDDLRKCGGCAGRGRAELWAAVAGNRPLFAKNISIFYEIK